MCQWLPYATLLAQQGYRVVAFDFAGFGASSPTKSKLSARTCGALELSSVLR